MISLWRWLSVGHWLAFVISVGAVVSLWQKVFVPGGLGSNVVIGMMIAGIAVYMITERLGPWLDAKVFFKSKASLIELLVRSKQMFQEAQLLRKKRINQKLNPANKEELIGLERELKQARVRASKAYWSDDKSQVLATHNLDVALQKLDSFLSKWRSEGGILSSMGSLAFILLIALGIRAFVLEPFQIPSGSMIPSLLVGDHLFVSKLSYGIPNPFSSVPSYFVRWSMPKPGDVIVFKAPEYFGRHAGSAWVKRVIAVAGQRVKLRDTVVYVDDKAYPHVMPNEEVSYTDFMTTSDFEDSLFVSPEGFWATLSAIHTTEKIGTVVHDIYQRTKKPVPYEVNWPVENRYPENFDGLVCDSEECTVQEGYVFAMGDNRGNSSDSRVLGGIPIDNIKGRAWIVWISVDGSRQSFQAGQFALPGFRFNRMFNMI